MRRAAGCRARPRRPKNKAKVENGVRFAQTCILGRLRRQTFFSLPQANEAIAGACDRINDHVMRRLGVSRRPLFETVEGPALASLPAEDYEFAEWRFARVATDYHVEFKELLLLRAAQPHAPVHGTQHPIAQILSVTLPRSPTHRRLQARCRPM